VASSRTSGSSSASSAPSPNAGCYKTVIEDTPVYIHPSSILYQKGPEWVIYHELVMTSREYMREVTAIDPRWLVEAAPTFFQVADPRQLSKRLRQEKIVPLHNKFEAPDEWRLSKRKSYFKGRTQRF